MDENTNFESADEMMREAELTFRRSLSTLREWGESTLQLVREKPETIMAAAGVSGLVAGALLRRSVSLRRTGQRPAGPDPSLLVAGGLILGALVGPRLVESAISLFEKPSEDNQRFEEDPYLRPTGTMNEKPFEKL
jgi:hypothetical protein